MRFAVLALVFALAAPAVALADEPHSRFSAVPDVRPKPPAAQAHAVKLTDGDVALIAFLYRRTGERCAQDPAFCQAQLELDDMVRRLDAQLSAEAAATATPSAAPPKH